MNLTSFRRGVIYIGRMLEVRVLLSQPGLEIPVAGLHVGHGGYSQLTPYSCNHNIHCY